MRNLLLILVLLVSTNAFTQEVNVQNETSIWLGSEFVMNKSPLNVRVKIDVKTQKVSDTDFKFVNESRKIKMSTVVITIDNDNYYEKVLTSKNAYSKGKGYESLISYNDKTLYNFLSKNVRSTSDIKLQYLGKTQYVNRRMTPDEVATLYATIRYINRLNTL